MGKNIPWAKNKKQAYQNKLPGPQETSELSSYIPLTLDEQLD